MRVTRIIQQFSQLGLVTTAGATVAAVGVANRLRTKKHLKVSPYPDIHHHSIDMTYAHDDIESGFSEGLQAHHFSDAYQGTDNHQ